MLFTLRRLKNSVILRRRLYAWTLIASLTTTLIAQPLTALSMPVQTKPSLVAVAATPPSFTAGNVTVYRVGATGGTTALSGTAAPVFLDEYNASGTLIQSLALPTAVNGANKRLMASGSAGSEGLLTRSTDGRYLNLTGYDADTGAAVTSVSAATVNRVVGRVDASGNIDTSTALNDAYNGTSSSGFAVRGGDITAGCKAADTIVSRRRRCCVVNVYVMVRVEIRIESDSEQSAFAV
jgi:hypothetical protein